LNTFFLLFKVILVALIAVAAGQMALPFGPYAAGVSYSSPFTFASSSAMAYGAVPPAYSGVPVPYIGAPVYVAPGPISYQTGAKIVAKYEPVEQHGYQIAY
jgi:hypothetical protein